MSSSRSTWFRLPLAGPPRLRHRVPWMSRVSAFATKGPPLALSLDFNDSEFNLPAGRCSKRDTALRWLRDPRAWARSGVRTLHRSARSPLRVVPVDPVLPEHLRSRFGHRPRTSVAAPIPMPKHGTRLCSKAQDGPPPPRDPSNRPLLDSPRSRPRAEARRLPLGFTGNQPDSRHPSGAPRRDPRRCVLRIGDTEASPIRPSHLCRATPIAPSRVANHGLRCAGDSVSTPKRLDFLPCAAPPCGGPLPNPPARGRGPGPRDPLARHASESDPAETASSSGAHGTCASWELPT